MVNINVHPMQIFIERFVHEHRLPNKMLMTMIRALNCKKNNSKPKALSSQTTLHRNCVRRVLHQQDFNDRVAR